MSLGNARPVSAPVLDAAIEWQLSLDDDIDEARHASFARWLAADEEHARAWAQLDALNRHFKVAPGPARKALEQSSGTLRRGIGKLGSGLASLVFACGLALLLGERYLPLDYWLADQRTATGEQRDVRLADNTLVRLNTHSAIDVRFDERQRRVVLQDGEILVETGNPDDPRPFIVETPDGRMRALGTRFLVKREAEATLLSVLKSAVAANSWGRPDERILRAGQQVRLTRGGLEPSVALPTGADAWTRGMLVVDDQRLAEVLSELGRYRTGHLGVDPRVADLRITGSFPLNDTDLALKALLPTLPVRIERHTRWWVTVSPRNDKPGTTPAKP